jgi:hypothetical protein
MSTDLPPSTKSRLVGQAEEILDQVKQEKGFRGQTAQLRNLLQIVQSESEIPVLRNFIRYQTGRRATRQFWQLIHEGVLTAIEGIGSEFSEVAGRRAALQSFFGYLVRHYVYLTETGGGAGRHPGNRGGGPHGAGGGGRHGAGGGGHQGAGSGGAQDPAAGART